MLQPRELSTPLPMKLSNNVVSTTDKVWSVLRASKNGQLDELKHLVEECPELIYAQYNYTPPIYFAVREGHLSMVKYLLEHGAHDPNYRTYPFQDNLQTIAAERGYQEIEQLLLGYIAAPPQDHFTGDNGEIDYQRTTEQIAFEKAVNKTDVAEAKRILSEHPEFAKDESFFWSEGILMMPSKGGHWEMMELLLQHGAAVPNLLKWAQYYYFERYDVAEWLLQHGMNRDVMSWHHVTLLHDMAQKGDVQKASLLIKHGATIDIIEDEYQSTPLGLAARWGRVEMVKFLLSAGADPSKAGAKWSTPLAWAENRNHQEIVELL